VYGNFVHLISWSLSRNMGGGASSNYSLFNEQIKNEIVNIFVNEHEKLKLLNIEDRNEIRAMFYDALTSKISDMATKSHSRLSSIKEDIDEDGDSKANDVPVFAKMRSKSFFVKKSRNNFLIAVDGSAQADTAFQCAMNLRKKADCMIVFHTHKSPEKMELMLPAHRASEIQRKYMELLSSLTPDLYHMVFVERKDHETVKSALETILKKLRNTSSSPSSSDKSKDANNFFGNMVPDFLVIGYSGRKKELENSVSVMGSSTDLALRSVPIPIVIVKKPCNAESRVFVYATDGKQQSKEGLDILLTLVMPRDTLVVVNIVSPTPDIETAAAAEATKSYFESELLRAGPVDSKFVPVYRENGQGVVECLLQYVNVEINPDFFVITPKAKKQIKSMTEELIINCQSSVILCKM
jgi:nucleotide-binding universal stress UspA family protein